MTAFTVPRGHALTAAGNRGGDRRPLDRAGAVRAPVSGDRQGSRTVVQPAAQLSPASETARDSARARRSDPPMRGIQGAEASSRRGRDCPSRSWRFASLSPAQPETCSRLSAGMRAPLSDDVGVLAKHEEHQSRSPSGDCRFLRRCLQPSEAWLAVPPHLDAGRNRGLGPSSTNEARRRDDVLRREGSISEGPCGDIEGQTSMGDLLSRIARPLGCRLSDG
jgi:hypothetical protein